MAPAGRAVADTAVARLRLIRTTGIGPVTYRQLIARFGNAQAAKAKEGLREEKQSREDQIRGDLKGAQQHKARAEEIKKELGIKEPKDEFKSALDDSEVLKSIRDNTAGSGKNK